MGVRMTIADRIHDARATRIIGRDAELGHLLALARSGETAVAFLHGMGGVGKSSLLRAFADHMAAHGRPVVAVDFGVTEPSLPAFEAAARAASEAVTPMVLTLDSFERFDRRSDWLRDRFLPGLPGGTLVLLSGRNPPDLGWHLDTAWSSAFHPIELRELDPTTAEALLSARHVPRADRTRILSFAAGNPLALHLCASLARSTGPEAIAWAPDPDVVATLLNRLIGAVPGPAHRRALEVCAHAWITTEELLRAVIEADAGELFEWLRRQPYTESTPLGLRLHDPIRTLLDDDLRWRDEESYRRIHDRLLEHLLDRVLTTTGDAVTPALQALHHALWNSEMDLDGELYASPATPADHDTIRRMARDTDGPLVDYWLTRQPESFELYRRSADDEPISYRADLHFTERDDDDARADPVLAEVWRQVDAAPLRPGEVIRVVRFVHPMIADRPPAITALTAMRQFIAWLRGPDAAWTFVTLVEGNPGETMGAFTDHDPADHPVVADGLRLRLYGHDWRARPRTAWASRVSWYALQGEMTTSEPRAAEITVLSQADFATAVRDALRHWRRPAALANNPLTRVRLVRDRTGGDRPAPEVLRELLDEAVAELRHDPRERKLHRVLTATYQHRAASQEAAAEELGLPFSTYRRHLSRGVERVTDHLWQRETS
jgi:hypothetical protein